MEVIPTGDGFDPLAGSGNLGQKLSNPALTLLDLGQLTLTFKAQAGQSNDAL